MMIGTLKSNNKEKGLEVWLTEIPVIALPLPKVIRIGKNIPHPLSPFFIRDVWCTRQ
jgi:hypothetical protein